MQKLLEVEKRAAKHGAAAVSIQAAVAQSSGAALLPDSCTGSWLKFAHASLLLGRRFFHTCLGRRQCRIVNKKCKCFLDAAFLNDLLFFLMVWHQPGV